MPYINKRQVISLMLALVLEILIIRSKTEMFKPLTAYFIVMIFITFVPSLRKNVKYPYILHLLIYYLPMLIIGLFHVDGYLKLEFFSYSIGVVIGLSLLLLNIKHNKLYLSIYNPQFYEVLSIKGFLLSVFEMSLSIIAEELFYRVYLTLILTKMYGFVGVVLSALIFVHSHYINRWAKTSFNMKSYFYQFLLGVLLGGLILKTDSIFACIIAHATFNSPKIILDYIRCFKRISERVYSFDDY